MSFRGKIAIRVWRFCRSWRFASAVPYVVTLTRVKQGSNYKDTRDRVRLLAGMKNNGGRGIPFWSGCAGAIGVVFDEVRASFKPLGRAGTIGI